MPECCLDHVAFVARARRAPGALVVGALVVCFAQGAALAPALEVEVTRLDGQVVRGRLAEVTPQIVLDTPTGPARLAWAELLGLRPVDEQAPTSAP